jgi:2-phosphoglycerate kinase
MLAMSNRSKKETKNMFDTHKILLIGGSSHVGKSTLAKSLAAHFGWSYCSTDMLARHPGHPWQVHPKQVPNHVAEHYLLLSADELITDVCHHYRENVWPIVKDIVTFHATDVSSERLVMEGSALLPELVNTLDFENIVTIWLTASDSFLKQRIYAASDYESKSHVEKVMIDKFVERNNLFNSRIISIVNQIGLTNVDVENESSLELLIDKCLSVLKKVDRPN